MDAIDRLLRRQAGVVSRRQVLAVGMSEVLVARRVRRREWVRVGDGVYVDHTGRLSTAQEEWAAMVAWAQLRVLGRLDRTRYRTGGAAAVPCALCAKQAGTPGRLETAAHLLGDCPRTAAWVAETLGGPSEE